MAAQPGSASKRRGAGALSIGDRVVIIAGERKGATGVVKYLGELQGASGKWVGLELDKGGQSPQLFGD